MVLVDSYCNKTLPKSRRQTVEMKAIFIAWKLVTTTFLLFDIRTPVEVYLQNLKSLRTLRNPPTFEAEGSETFQICHFPERCPKEYIFDVCEVSENQKRQKNVPKEYTLIVSKHVFWMSAKSAKPSSFWGRRFWDLWNLSFFWEMPKRIRFPCLWRVREPEKAEKCTKRKHPNMMIWSSIILSFGFL